jgi:hypothetical protein
VCGWDANKCRTKKDRMWRSCCDGAKRPENLGTRVLLGGSRG